MAGNESPRSAVDGFTGELAGLSLSDIVQLNVQNRFSGCIAAQHEGRRGLIFFHDGAIVHAEEGEDVGEEAFYTVLGWPAGQFSAQPNVVSTRRTIDKSCPHLVLEAHRRIDERRPDFRASPPVSREPARKASSIQALVDRVRRIPGVTHAVLQDKDGKRLGDDAYEAETLAGQAAFLAMLQDRLGSLFRAGKLHSAAVQGTSHHLVLLVGRTYTLSVLVDAEWQAGAVETDVRRTLVGGA